MMENESYKTLKNNFNRKIEVEYRNYLTKLKIFDIIDARSKTPKEDKSYIEAFLFQRTGYQNYDNTPPFHPYKRVTKEEFDAMTNLIYSHIPYIDEIIELINNRSDIPPESDYDKKIKIDKDYLYIHKLKFPLDDRIRYLLSYSKKMLKKHTNYKCIVSLSRKLVVRCLLRYSSLGITGNQCSLSSTLYNYLYENLNIRGEGFCSPLNSKLIEKNDTIICSVFKDTDKYFKSSGQFNKNIMLEHTKINWILNPPFLSSTTKLSIKSVQQTLELSYDTMTIILVVPFTKVQMMLNDFHNDFLFGFINQNNIEIKSRFIQKSNRKIIPRKNNKQYFICNGIASSNFEDIYMFFYTNEPHEIVYGMKQLEAHMIKISDIWGSDNTEDQQSKFREPIFI